MSSSKNKIFEITSFLSATNNDYINEMYKKFVNQDDDLPNSWKQYFDGLEEDNNQIKKNISGVHWKPQKVKINEDYDLDSFEKFLPKNLLKNKKSKIKKNNQELSSEEVEEQTKNAVRAIMMIRALRIRGHIKANLDPLNLIKKEETPELDIESYGFTKEDLNKKIFLDDVLGLKYAKLSEIVDILNRTYCNNIGYEFMHITDPN